MDIIEILGPMRFPLMLLFLFFIGSFFVCMVLKYTIGSIEKRCRVITFEPKAMTNMSNAEGNPSMQFPSPITGKALHVQMNEAYFDAIFSAFLRSLQRAGYTLSDRETGVAPLLSGSTIDAMAREVESARQEFVTVLGSDIKADIDYQMQSGRAPKFLIQLIDSCERLGWKVMPVVREPEDECASSFSALP